jgi:hypothetical protein
MSLTTTESETENCQAITAEVLSEQVTASDTERVRVAAGNEMAVVSEQDTASVTLRNSVGRRIVTPVSLVVTASVTETGSGILGLETVSVQVTESDTLNVWRNLSAWSGSETVTESDTEGLMVTLIPSTVLVVVTESETLNVRVVRASSVLIKDIRTSGSM